MKTTSKLIGAALALSIVGPAFAAATIQDVETAVKVNHDFRQGENLIREVVAGNPNDARDHFVYSQILRHNGKHDDAVHEFAEAKRLDPALSFDKNPARVADYEARLNAEGEHRPAYALPQPSAVSPYAQPAEMPLIQPAEHRSGHVLPWMLLLLAVLGVAGYFFYRRTQEHDRVEDEARMKTVRQEQLKQANALLESVKPLKLDIRMANPPDTALLTEVDDAEKQLVDSIERLAKLPVPQSEIDRQAENLAHLRRKFEGKPDPAPTLRSTYEHEQYGESANVVQPGANPVYQQPMQQTVYVDNNSGGLGVGGGLLAGLALGGLMESIQGHETIREIHEAPNRRYDSNAGGEPDGNRENIADNIDFGNESSVDFGDSADS